MAKGVRGIGIDLVSVERFKTMSLRAQERLFTPSELEYCHRFKKCEERLAGRYASKEALAKALGKGVREEFQFLDVEILPDEWGAPQIHLKGKLAELNKECALFLSISHDAGFAIAQVLVEKSD